MAAHTSARLFVVVAAAADASPCSSGICTRPLPTSFIPCLFFLTVHTALSCHSFTRAGNSHSLLRSHHSLEASSSKQTPNQSSPSFKETTQSFHTTNRNHAVLRNEAPPGPGCPLPGRPPHISPPRREPWHSNPLWQAHHPLGLHPDPGLRVKRQHPGLRRLPQHLPRCQRRPQLEHMEARGAPNRCSLPAHDPHPCPACR